MFDIKKLPHIFLLILAVVLIFATLPAAAATDVSGYDRFKISFWPEYDHTDQNKSVLVIYRGRLPDNIQFPARVRFLIPKNSSILAATAVESGGRLLTKPFDQLPAGDYDELAYNVDSPEFQFELYYYPVGANVRREFDFNVRLLFPVKTLEFEIQKPLEATEFNVEPASSNINSRENFEYHNYSFADLPADKEISYKVAYNKADNKPSVSTQPGQDSTTGGGATDTGGRGNTILITILIMALIFGLLATGIAVGIRRSQATAAVPAGKQFKTSKYRKNQRPKPKNDKHCANCGEKITANAKFCTSCGAKTN